MFLLLGGQKFQQANLPDVRDYGAKADALVGGQWNLNPTNCGMPFTNAAAANPNGIIYVPPGPWFMEAINPVCAWLIQRACLFIMAPGANIYFRGTPTTDCLLIEGADQFNLAAGTVIDGLTLAQYGGATQSGRAGVVVHAPFCGIDVRSIDGMGKWGVIIESGNAGDMQAGTLYANPDQYINSNFWSVSGRPYGSARITDCGALPTPPYAYVEGGGAGIFAHGSDSVGAIDRIYGNFNNASYHDATLAGVSLEVCYSEFSNVPIVGESSAGSKLFDCKTEDLFAPIWRDGGGGRSAFGTLLGSTYFDNTCSPHSVSIPAVDAGNNPETFVLTLGLPGHEAILEFYRTYAGVPGPPVHSLRYEPPTWPSAYGMWLATNGNTVPKSDPNGVAWGWTDWDHPRGPDLWFLGRPSLNTRKRNHWRQQNITLVPGVNVISTTVNWQNSFNDWRGDPTLKAGSSNDAYTKVSVQIEQHYALPDVHTSMNPQDAEAQMAARATALAAFDVDVGPTACAFQDNNSGAWLVRLVNNGSQNVAVDIIWSFELYQTTQDSNTQP